MERRLEKFMDFTAMAHADRSNLATHDGEESDGGVTGPDDNVFFRFRQNPLLRLFFWNYLRERV